MSQAIAEEKSRGQRLYGLLDWLVTGDHKKIGIMYLWFSLVMALVGGSFAGIIRAQLTTPEMRLVTPEFYNSLVAMHATLMIFFVVVPGLTGFGNYFVPLLIGARDMAFPRLNALGFWMAVPAAALMFGSFFVAGGAAQAGWTEYPPLSLNAFSAGLGVDMWLMGVILIGVSSILGAINFLVTVINMRAPGMNYLKMPLFVWAWFINASLILVATPVLSSALAMVLTDRVFGTSFLSVAKGGDPLLYQHLFWFYSHPAVYIMILPGFGVISHVTASFSEKRIFGYRGMVTALALIGIIGYLVWAHHMFVAGIPAWLQLFFSYMSMVIAVPTGIKVFSWLATIWGGNIRFATPMKFALGFISLFVIGGMSGILLANVPVDYQVHDSYFVVAHFHYVLVGGSIMAGFAASYFWFPKMSGRMLSEKLGTWVFWLFFIGMNVTFFPQHFLGIQGMARRIFTYRPEFTALNAISSFGYLFMLAAGLLFFADIVRRSFSRIRQALPDDPWQVNHVQNTLDWKVSSPPPEYNFLEVPKIS
ncbi:MAG TPA: cytochrome c oxidase subunit I [Candidatus Glassbacteria bacterium]|nr:cytochrome c oxidase subunit I [Candidatus Glassbacteria bacterium]